MLVALLVTLAQVRAPLAGPLDVVAGASVDPQTVANVDEERHADDHACLHGRRLGPAAGCIALEAGIGLGNFQNDRNSHLDIDRFPAVGPGSDNVFTFTI